MSEPLVVFVHTPKTAGSTINASLAALGPGMAHVEAHKSDTQAFRAMAEQMAWLSGHVTITDFQTLLAGLDRPVRYFSVMRAPSAHVRSHYNWLIEIFHKGPKFYDSHPPHVKAISEAIRAADRNAPDSIVEMLRRYRGLFLNFQSRFILGQDFDWRKGRLQAALSRFEYVGDGSDLDSLLQAIKPGLVAAEDVNVSRYHFDPELFDSPVVTAFLATDNAHDIALHARVVKRNRALSAA